MFFLDFVKKDLPLIWIRRTVVVVLLSLLIVFSVALIMKMVNEEPGIKTTYDTKIKSQPVPNLYFSFDKQFNISCYYTGGEICPDYFNGGIDDRDVYYYSYFPKGQILLDVNRNLVFTIYINDETYNQLNESSPMTMHAYDSEYPYQNKHKPKFLDSIEVGNEYYITKSNGSNVYYFEFYRLMREELDNSFLTLIGFYPKYEKYNYIESQMQNIEYSSQIDAFAKMTVKLKTSILEIEKEQRVRTITEVLAMISALYGLMLSIYVYLFGERRNKPLLGKYMLVENPSSDDLKV